MLIAVGYAGQVIGALVFGWAAERFGRVPSVTTTVGLMSVMSIVCAVSGNFTALFALRFIQGIGVGGEVPIAAAYINELSQAKGRGKFFILYELIFPLGLLAAAQVGAWVVPRFGWEYMFMVGGIPGLIIVFFLARLPESPRWLINQGRFEQAERIIERIEASTPKRSLDPKTEKEAIAERVASLAEGLHKQAKKASWKGLFSPVYRSRTLVVWVLWAASYFVANGINNWLPTLYKTVYHLPLQDQPLPGRGLVHRRALAGGGRWGRARGERPGHRGSDRLDSHGHAGRPGSGTGRRAGRVRAVAPHLPLGARGAAAAHGRAGARAHADHRRADVARDGQAAGASARRASWLEKL